MYTLGIAFFVYYVYGITLEIGVGKELVYLDVFLDNSNYKKLEVLLLGGLLGHAGDKVSVSNEGIKLGKSDGKVLGTIFGDVDEITLGIDVGKRLVALRFTIICLW